MNRNESSDSQGTDAAEKPWLLSCCCKIPAQFLFPLSPLSEGQSPGVTTSPLAQRSLLPLPLWVDIGALAGQLTGRERGKQRDCPMENISSRHLACSQSIPEMLSAFLSMGTRHPEAWDEIFTSTAGSPSQALIFTGCSSFTAGLQIVGSVCGCSLTSPGQSQATRSRLGTSHSSTPSLGKYSCWEPATGHNLQLKGNKRARTNPLGTCRRSSVVSLTN